MSVYIAVRRFSFSLSPVFCFFAALVASYLIAPRLPASFGWENGPIENLQAALLLVGGIWAFRLRAASPEPRYRAFWLLIAPIWLAMFARELSWGAVLLQPLDVSTLTGPVFSSTKQLWYKPAIAPALLLLLLLGIGSFIRNRQTLTVGELWRSRSLPLLEIALFVFVLFASAIAEGHMGMNLDELGEAGAQNFEELVELWGYLLLIGAQWRVARCLKQLQSSFHSG